jgi:hypothetical protein
MAFLNVFRRRYGKNATLKKNTWSPKKQSRSWENYFKGRPRKVAEFTGELSPGQKRTVTRCGEITAKYEAELAQTGCKVPQLQKARGTLLFPDAEANNTYNSTPFDAVPDWGGGTRRRRSKSRQSSRRRRKSSKSSKGTSGSL